ncbi:unnamed protein product [Musa acuminata subsp. burmannicoides]
MAFRTMEITLISAKDLKNVNVFSKMTVYAVVTISSDPRVWQRTPTDREGGRNPSWNSTHRLTVPNDVAHHHFLHILLRTERALGDRDIGEVRVPLSDLLAGAGDGPRPVQFVSYQVHGMTSGKAKGVLNFSYSLSEQVLAPATASAAAPFDARRPPVTSYPAVSASHSAPSSAKTDEPVMAYPPGPSSAPYPAYAAAPPPYPPQSGYQQAPPYGYGYGYPPAGYGYGAAPAPVVQPQRKNRLGMGLGAGLLGGALGGFLIGDMMSDASAYDAGYDAGFDDAGDFGF